MRIMNGCYTLWLFFLISLLVSSAFSQQVLEQALNNYKSYKYTRAIAGFQQVLQERPMEEIAMMRLIDCYRETRKRAAGIDYFQNQAKNDPDNALWYYGEGSLLRSAEKPEEAASAFEKALQRSPSFADQVRGFVEAHRSGGTLGEALNFFRENAVGDERSAVNAYGVAYSFYRLREPDSSLVWLDRALAQSADLGDAIVLKVRIMRNSGQYEEGLRLAAAAIKNSNDPKLKATLQMHSSIIRYFSGEYDVAQKDISEAQKVFAELGEMNLYLDALNINGLLYGAADQLPLSLQFYREGLAIAEARQMQEQQGIMFGNLGDVHTILSQYDSARVYYDRSAHLLAAKNDQLNLAATVGAIAAVHSYQGQYQEALRAGQRALDIYVALDHPSGQTSELMNFGVLYLETGQYFQALRYLNQALRIAREIGEKPKEQMCLGNIGETYIKLGRFDEARESLQDAVRIARELGADSQLGQMIGKIGSAYMAGGNYDEATRFFEEALRTLTATGHVREEAITSSQLGDAYRLNGRSDLSMSLYQRALRLHDQIGNRLGRASTLLSMGELYLQKMTPDKAAYYFQQAVTTGEEIRANGPIWQGYQGLANVERQRGNMTKALQLYQTAINALEDVRNQIVLAEFQSSFLDNQFEMYETILDVLAQLYTETGDAAYLHEAFGYSERARARALLNIVSSGQLPLHPDVPQALQQQKKVLEWRFRNFHDKLTWLYSLPEEQRDPAMLVDVGDSLDAANSAYQQLLDDIRMKFPGYASLQGFAEAMSLEAVQNQIVTDDKTALLQYFVGRDKTLSWVITANSAKMVVIDLGESALRQQLNDVSPQLFPLTAGSEMSSAPRDAGWANIRSQTLHDLHELLIKPVAEEIVAMDNLIVVPDNILTYLPFEMLVTSMSEDSLRYLIEDFAISYSASASLLNPALHATDNQNMRQLLALAVESFKDSSLSELPYAKKEAGAISNMFADYSQMLAADATEEAFKREAGKFQMLHLATHYLPNDVHPFSSYIALAGNTSETAEEDGRLHAYEIVGRRFNADMVVLSACQTGTGVLAKGEGLIGISRAFMYAGARSLVSAKWGASDQSTAELMTNFYRELQKGQNKRAALQTAKLQLIRSGGQWANPFYWAPFILEGDNRPLNIQQPAYFGLLPAGIFLLVIVFFLVLLRNRIK